MVTSEMALWRAVISQAILDLKLPASLDDNGRDRNDTDRQQAINWFTRAGSDFRMVCSLADLEASRVQAYAIQNF